MATNYQAKLHTISNYGNTDSLSSICYLSFDEVKQFKEAIIAIFFNRLHTFPFFTECASN